MTDRDETTTAFSVTRRLTMLENKIDRLNLRLMKFSKKLFEMEIAQAERNYDAAEKTKQIVKEKA